MRVVRLTYARGDLNIKHTVHALLAFFFVRFASRMQPPGSNGDPANFRSVG